MAELINTNGKMIRIIPVDNKKSLLSPTQYFFRIVNPKQTDIEPSAIQLRLLSFLFLSISIYDSVHTKYRAPNSSLQWYEKTCIDNTVL
jgi:hypothetical protein